MNEQLTILAEHAMSATPFLVGGGMFLLLMFLLAVTYLFSGLHQRAPKKSSEATVREATDRRHH